MCSARSLCEIEARARGELWSRHAIAISRSSDGTSIYVYSPFVGYHRDADDYSDERFCPLAPTGWKGVHRARGDPVVVNENVGRSLEIAFDSISDPSGTRNYVIAVLARRAGYFYFILSRTFGLSTCIYTRRRHRRPFATSKRGALARDNEIK